MAQKPEEEQKGYLFKLQEINDKAFSVDLQGVTSSTRIVCFSPEKRKLLESKIKSPVKIRIVKTEKDKI